MAGAELDVEPLSRDEIIRGNLEAFLPYICYCVKATDLFKLQYFSKEQRRQVFQLFRNDGVGATKMAMNIVLHECEDPGRFVALKYAMESSDYPKIVQMLEGEHVPCDENCKKILDLFTHEIVKRLNPIELLAVLISQGTLSSEDADEIRAEEQNHSRIRACYMLLFYLPNRVENWFKYFEEALIICGYEDIAEILEPELCSKIMLQRRAEEEEIVGQVSEETWRMESDTCIEKQLGENDSAPLVACDDGSKREDRESDDSITEQKGIADRRPSAETEVRKEALTLPTTSASSFHAASTPVIYNNNLDFDDSEEEETPEISNGFTENTFFTGKTPQTSNGFTENTVFTSKTPETSNGFTENTVFTGKTPETNSPAKAVVSGLTVSKTSGRKNTYLTKKSLVTDDIPDLNFDFLLESGKVNGAVGGEHGLSMRFKPERKRNNDSANDLSELNLGTSRKNGNGEKVEKMKQNWSSNVNSLQNYGKEDFGFGDKLDFLNFEELTAENETESSGETDEGFSVLNGYPDVNMIQREKTEGKVAKEPDYTNGAASFLHDTFAPQLRKDSGEAVSRKTPLDQHDIGCFLENPFAAGINKKPAEGTVAKESDAESSFCSLLKEKAKVTEETGEENGGNILDSIQSVGGLNLVSEMTKGSRETEMLDTGMDFAETLKQTFLAKFQKENEEKISDSTRDSNKQGDQIVDVVREVDDKAGTKILGKKQEDIGFQEACVDIQLLQEKSAKPCTVIVDQAQGATSLQKESTLTKDVRHTFETSRRETQESLQSIPSLNDKEKEQMVKAEAKSQRKVPDKNINRVKQTGETTAITNDSINEEITTGQPVCKKQDDVCNTEENTSVKVDSIPKQTSNKQTSNSIRETLESINETVGGELDFSSLLNDSSCQQESVGFNDLNTEVEHPSEEQDYNIVTDEDVIEEVKDEDISLRNYQKELAKEGAEGDSVVIMAPTNSGKTRVACKIMQEHLRRQRAGERIGKVIFLVENEALAFQQGKVCAELLPAYRTKVISGSVQRDKKQYLRDFVNRRDILVVTAQVLVNALKLKEVRCLTQFSMIVFDECHHTASLHRFNEIMNVYMDLKLKAELSADKLPQIVGLTASLGVGGKTTEEGALQHMKGLLANHDAKHLCTVRRNIEELRSFETNPDEGIVVAKKREKDVYGKAICDIVELISLYMSSHQSMLSISSSNKSLETVCQVPPYFGTKQFKQWLSDFKEAIGKIRSDEARRMLNPCRLHLEMYNQALLIHKDARIQDAQEILEEFMKEERKVPPKNETDAMLIELYRTLERKDVSNEPPNPKLVKLEEIILNNLGNNQDARAIVFVETRELAKALVAWINQTESLKDLHAEEFVGQGASAAQGGMTKSGQKDVLEYFKGGRTKIIVATSVAEEGLDITKCNLVIRYEYVTNEIARSQSRGRARACNSKYFVLTEEGSWIVAKEEKNTMLEELMNRVVPKLQEYIENNPNLWEKELNEIQMVKKMAEDLREKQRKEYMTNEEMELRCLNCSHFICFSSDIRLIQNTHFVVIEEDVQKRLISRRDPDPKFIEEDLQYGGDVFCGNVDCQRKLGGVCEFQHAEFPMIKIRNFQVVNKNGSGRTFKKWKGINFYVQKFTLDDLRNIVDRRRENFKIV